MASTFQNPQLTAPPQSAHSRAVPPVFTLDFTPSAADIDELGHVNNAVWVRWIQQIAIAHWEAVAAPAHRELFYWVVTRHEIDYLGNVALGQRVAGETWISEPPRGARFNRNIAFADERGKTLVRARTTWALLDRTTGRLARVRADLAAPFLGSNS